MKKNTETDLSMIKNITSLDQLVLYDLNIRRFANCKIKEKHLVDDFVNEMYIKVYKSFENGKTINGGYIVLIIENLYKNHIKFEKRYQQEIGYQHDSEDKSKKAIEEKYIVDERFDEMYELIDSRLKWFEKKILELSYQMPLTELSKRSKIPYASLIYTSNKIKNKLDIKKNK